MLGRRVLGGKSQVLVPGAERDRSRPPVEEGPSCRCLDSSITSLSGFRARGVAKGTRALPFINLPSFASSSSSFFSPHTCLISRTFQSQAASQTTGRYCDRNDPRSTAFEFSVDRQGRGR